MWLSIDVLEAIIETGVGHKYLLSIQWVFLKCNRVKYLTVGHFVTAERPKIVLFPRQKSFFFHIFVVWTSDLPHVCIAKSFY